MGSEKAKYNGSMTQRLLSRRGYENLQNLDFSSKCQGTVAFRVITLEHGLLKNEHQ